ncbi:MAG: HmuY family protein [Gemmatimonadota bacterium]
MSVRGGGVERKAAGLRRLPRITASLMIVSGVVGLAVVFVGVSLLRPQPRTFAPSPVLEQAPPSPLEGVQVRTVEATDPDRWRFFSLERGSVVEVPGPDEWDLGMRRFQVMVNGGDGFAGLAGVQLLAGAEFEAIDRLPAEGYVQAEVRGDSLNPAVQEWYDYSLFSHLLTPRPEVFAVRTARGGHAKLQFLGYYCPGPQPGCVTFRYRFLPTED